MFSASSRGVNDSSLPCARGWWRSDEPARNHCTFRHLLRRSRAVDIRKGSSSIAPSSGACARAPTHSAQVCFHSGGRFSKKAAMPSLASSVENAVEKRARS